MTTLTPPADAPLPWRIAIDPHGLIVVTGDGRKMLDAAIDDLDAARYLVAAANAAPGLVEAQDRLTVERDLARDEQAYWNRIAQENRAQYLTVADAIAPSSNNAHELADRVRAFRKRAEALAEERDTALARVTALEQELAKQAPVIAGVRKNAANDVHWYGPSTRSWATDMVALLDNLDPKETP